LIARHGTGPWQSPLLLCASLARETDMSAKNIAATLSLDLSQQAGVQSSTRHYPNGQAIFSQGDKADAVFYIQSGHVKLTVSSKGGKKAVIGILRQGDLFGEGCLNQKSLRTSSATAMQRSDITRVKRADIARMIHREPAFAKLFISHLLLRLCKVEDGLVDQVCITSERRLARILLLLAGFGMESNTEPDLPKVSQETLAEMVGTTRSRVSHFMNHFREMGFIDYNGRLHVHEGLRTFLLEQ
jgi:CRP/FNR family cyclic AMP-dependent transcriptional regulator